MDTIYALASGPPPSSVAVIRLSGRNARVVAETMVGRSLQLRVGLFCSIKNPFTGALLDRGIVIYFPTPASFTGEDVVEFQVHGSKAVLAAILYALGTFKECRPAKGGEFTRRAFLNGKMDLTAVEGLGDLIDSETELQRQQAISIMTGSLSGLIGKWRSAAVEILASLEAAIDFSDESDVSQVVESSAREDIVALRNSLERALSDGRRGELLRAGYSVVLLGPPNVGKSALLNLLANRDVAIVSATAGTTRDLIEVQLDLDGVPVTFVDTAGVRETLDEIENEGIRRAVLRSQTANLILWLTELNNPLDPPLDIDPAKIMLIATKADLALPSSSIGFGCRQFAISTSMNCGIEEFLVGLRARLGFFGEQIYPAAISRARQRALMESAVEAFDRAACPRLLPELSAEEMRRALRLLDGLLGSVDSEDVLDEIFRKFCIGK